MLSRSSEAYKSIRQCTLELIEGRVVCIDPSMGSESSLPGFAVYIAGKLITSGTFPIDINQSRPDRLQQLSYYIRRLYMDHDPDVLVYEEIPVQAYGRNAKSHASLLNALGVVLSISGPKYYVGMFPRSWQALARSTYVKSDQADAEEIGYVALTEAARIRAEEGSRKKKFGKKERG